MAEDLFSSVGAHQPTTRVLMSLDPPYYDLMWAGLKRHEFRRRYLRATPTTWFVYLTAPVSMLAPVIDLDPAIEGDAAAIAAIAEQVRPGNGASVHEYLRSADHGFAAPIRQVREYAAIRLAELVSKLGVFHPPQGYVLIDKHAELAAVCDTLTAAAPIRKMDVAHSVQPG